MTYELFVTTFDRAATAAEVSSWLQERVRGGDVQVLEVVVLARRPDGSTHLRELGDLGSQHHRHVGAIAGRLLGGLLGKPGGPAAIVALGSAGAAIGAAGGRHAAGGLYPDDLKEFAQALAPGSSALLAILAPKDAAAYARHIAGCGGETMQFSMSNDGGREFQEAKHAFIVRQAERREQPATSSSTSAEKAADLEAMNQELAQLYATMSSTPDWQQANLGVQAAARRTRRDAARALLDQSLAAEIQRLDETIARYQEAIARATSKDTRAALAAQNELLHRRRGAAEQELAASQDAELRERWRDIAALQAFAAHANPETRITLDMQLAELRAQYAAAREVSSTARALTNSEPTQRILALGAQVQCSDGYGGCVMSLIVDPGPRRLTHLVVQDYTVPAVERLVPIERLVATTRDRVTLNCTRETLAALEPFTYEYYIRSSAPDYQPIYAVDAFAEFRAKYIPVVTERIPPGELAIGGGAQVMAGDKPIGEVTAFVAEAASCDISSIHVRQGEWPISRERAIPIAAVERIGIQRLYLKPAHAQATPPARPRD